MIAVTMYLDAALNPIRPIPLSIHAGEEGDEDLGARLVAWFVQAADDAGLPDFRAGLRAYMEWAVVTSFPTRRRRRA